MQRGRSDDPSTRSPIVGAKGTSDRRRRRGVGEIVKVADDDQVLRVDIPQLGVEGACLSIIGALGESFGITLFPSHGGHEAFVAAGSEPQEDGATESQLDQSVKSRVGAIGVMQVMPATGKDLKVGDVKQAEANIHAGVKYMRFMIDQYYEKEPMTKKPRPWRR